MRTNLIFLFLLYHFCLFSQTIPEERLTDWSTAGHVGAFMEPANIINFEMEGGIGDGVTPNDLLLQSLLVDNFWIPSIIYFPEGDFLFNDPIFLHSNIILRGESPDLTKLKFDLSIEDHAISALGFLTTDSLFVQQEVSKKDRQLTTNSASSFQANDFIYLQDHDLAKVTSSWGLHSTGQICQIESIGDHLNLTNEIRRDYLLADNPVAVKVLMAENIGIENLTIERLDANTAQTSNVNLRYTSNCWLKCVESINCNYSHIEARYSTNLEISDCYIHDAFSHGSGGKAYGVMLHFGTGESLIYNNVFEDLRHSMILQAGANGNVFAYNYSFDPYWTSVALPSNSAGDLVLHGNYPYANLFEGNIIAQMIIDNSHGINGPRNTFFRNRAELYGLFMNNNPASSGQNFVGNEITNEGGLLGLYILEGTDHFEFGNNQTGTFHPSGSNMIPEASLFLTEAPEYYLNQSNWPPIGTPTNLNEFSIDAKERFEMGQATPCSAIVSSAVAIENVDQLKLYPNPSSQTLFIDSGNIEYDRILIRDILGHIVLESTSSNLDIAQFEDGIYFVTLLLENNPLIISSFVKL